MLTCPLCKLSLFTVGRIFSAIESGTFTFTLSPFVASSTLTCRYRSPGPARAAGAVATADRTQNITIPHSCFLIFGKPPVLFLLICTEWPLQMFRDFSARLGWQTTAGLGRSRPTALLALKLEINSGQRRDANLQRISTAIPRHRLRGPPPGIPLCACVVHRP